MDLLISTILLCYLLQKLFILLFPNVLVSRPLIFGFPLEVLFYVADDSSQVYLCSLLHNGSDSHCAFCSDEAVGSSEEEPSCGDVETSEAQDSSSRKADHELKEMLLKKYSGYLSSLRKEFLKKRKKGNLPKDARLTLLDWWNTHYRWPYPTVIFQAVVLIT